MNSVVIVGAARTPIGSFMGSLSQVPVHKLASSAISGAIAQAGLSPDEIDEAYFGCVLPARQGSACLKKAILESGLSASTPCTTLNKYCASGMKSIMVAAQSLKCGDQQTIIAGGMESMSNTPYYLQRDKTSIGPIQLEDSMLYDALVDGIVNSHAGVIAEKTATKMGICRKHQDDYATRSYQRVLKATSENIFDKEIVPVEIATKKGTLLVKKDEEPQRVDFEKLPTLRPAFQQNGSITAGNASTINDGAAALLLMTETKALEKEIKPLAKIIGFKDAALEPVEFPSAPALAVTKLLASCGLSKDDIDLWEINEAFSAVALANIRLLDLDIDKVNINGGAVSLGHPIGMSGARITGHLVHNLKPRQLGLATICNGGGGASAILLERL